MALRKGYDLKEIIKKYIYKILNKENLLQGEWQLGRVQSVISSKMLNVYVNGSTVTQKIPCNPDVAFKVNDEVWVVCVNRDSKNKFVISRRGV